jgi:predicted short-subunit dehydrogenase-like oxidoreductase (DUF2520 family)
MKISLIGAGNMAWQLAKVLTEKNHEIDLIYSRNVENAVLLCEEIKQGKPVSKLDFSNSQSDLFLLCIPDQAFEAVLSELKLPKNSILTHTSGSHSIQLLKKGKFENVDFGVFYPFQTMSKTKLVDFAKVPICLEATTQLTYEKLQELAESLSPKVHQVDSATRKKLHLSAVFACNFTNHLLAVSNQLLQEDGLEIGLLKHLVEETIEKAFSMPPKDAQTGPAIRRDENIISTHLEMLEGKEELQEIYSLLTKSIQGMRK